MIYFILLNEQYTAKEAVIYFLFGILVFFISISTRELFRGIVATKMGDLTPKLAGRVTFNPIKHLDFSGFLAFMLLGIGWAKPMPINPLNFKKYRTGTRLVALTGILTHFIIGLIAAIISAILYATVGVGGEAMEYVYQLLSMFMIVNSCLTMFHLLPIYPEDCFIFITSFMKTENKFIRFNMRYGTRILIGILFFSVLFEMFTGIDILDFYLNIIYKFIYFPILLLGVV